MTTVCCSAPTLDAAHRREVRSNVRKSIKRLTELALTYPWVVLGAAAILTLLSGWLASSLEIHSSFEELLPPNVSSVIRIKELVRRVGGDGTVLVTIESLDRSEDLSYAETLARELADEYSRLGRSAIRSV